MTLYFVFQNVVLEEQSDQVTQESQVLQAKVASKEEIIQAQVSEVIKSCFMPIAQCTQFPSGLFSSRDKRKNLSKQLLQGKYWKSSKLDFFENPFHSMAIVGWASNMKSAPI